MANIKSAKKRILVAEKRAARNKSIRSKVKTSVKKVDAAIAANDKEAAKKALTAATSLPKPFPKAYITRILLPEKFPD